MNICWFFKVKAHTKYLSENILETSPDGLILILLLHLADCASLHSRVALWLKQICSLETCYLNLQTGNELPFLLREGQWQEIFHFFLFFA